MARAGRGDAATRRRPRGMATAVRTPVPGLLPADRTRRGPQTKQAAGRPTARPLSMQAHTRPDERKCHVKTRERWGGVEFPTFEVRPCLLASLCGGLMPGGRSARRRSSAAPNYKSWGRLDCHPSGRPPAETASRREEGGSRPHGDRRYRKPHRTGSRATGRSVPASTAAGS